MILAGGAGHKVPICRDTDRPTLGLHIRLAAQAAGWAGVGGAWGQNRGWPGPQVQAGARERLDPSLGAPSMRRRLGAGQSGQRGGGAAIWSVGRPSNWSPAGNGESPACLQLHPSVGPTGTAWGGLLCGDLTAGGVSACMLPWSGAGLSGGADQASVGLASWASVAMSVTISSSSSSNRTKRSVGDVNNPRSFLICGVPLPEVGVLWLMFVMS